MKTWQWVAIAVVVLVVIGALSGGDDDGGDGGDDQEQAAVSASDGPRERVEDALSEVTGPVEDPEVSDVEVQGDFATVNVQTPEGGFEGASTQDLDWQAGAVFRDLYGEAGFEGDAVLSFRGGLVDSRTGKDLPNALTARYEISQAEAKRIDWSDEDTIEAGIDWSLYRLSVHPAIKDA